MTKYYGDTQYSGVSDFHNNPRKKPWRTTFIVLAWIVGIIIVLAAIFIWIASAYLKPERIVKLIEEKSSEYVDADIHIGNLDYKIFGSYPWLEFEVDSLEIISKSLNGISQTLRDSIPPNSDFLASVAKIQGKINIHSLLHDKIKLKDLYIRQPKVNIVMVNDTVCNFNIASNMKSPSKVPSIELGEIKVDAPVDFSFFSLPYDIEGQLNVEDFFFIKDKDDTRFNIGFEGIADGRFQSYRLPGNVPIKFSTYIKPNLSGLAVNLQNLSVSVAGVAIDAEGDIIMKTNGFDIVATDLKVRIDDICAILKYLPENVVEMIHMPQGLWGFIPLEVDASLSSPFHLNPKNIRELSIDSLPGVVASVKLSDGRLTYQPPHGKKVEVDDVSVFVSCSFDPQNPELTEINIRKLSLYGEGISLSGDVQVKNLLGQSQPVDGNFSFSSSLLKSLSYLLPNSPIKINGHLNGDVNLSGEALALGQKGFKNISLSGNILSHALDLNSDTYGKVGIKNLKTDFEAAIPAYPIKNYSDTRLGMNLSSDSIHLLEKDLMISMTGLKLNVDALDTVNGSPNPDGDLSIRLNSLKAAANGNKFNAEDISVKASGTLNSNGAPNYKVVAATTPGNDALLASDIVHTPLTLEYNGGGILSTLMNMVTLKTDMSLGKGSFSSPDYLLPVSFRGINLSSDLNNLSFTSSWIQIGRSGFSAFGDFSGLQPFLTSYQATPLKATAEINFNNVDINQLAWGYYGAIIKQGADSVFQIPALKPYTAADSVCVAIPRNIDAFVRLKSDKAEYMGYSFAPLSTDIVVKDGNATLGGLTVGTPYCKAVVDWTYSTAMLNDIFMNLSAKVEDFNFSNFYGSFPSLVEKSPELKDFTGILNADINCRFSMFPDMFMEAESLTGRFDIKGTQLQFARQGKIERITHLMLIEGDEPIQIRNIDITGGYHDNLLQINPFKISFDEYQLEVAGVNNTAGDMYYHLALEKSPFHLPFGVTLHGKMKHPEVKVGGTHFNDYKAEMVSEDVNTPIDVNIMAWLRRGWLMFIQEAAKYGQTHSPQ